MSGIAQGSGHGAAWPRFPRHILRFDVSRETSPGAGRAARAGRAAPARPTSPHTPATAMGAIEWRRRPEAGPAAGPPSPRPNDPSAVRGPGPVGGPEPVRRKRPLRMFHVKPRATTILAPRVCGLPRWGGGRRRPVQPCCGHLPAASGANLPQSAEHQAHHASRRPTPTPGGKGDGAAGRSRHRGTVHRGTVHRGPGERKPALGALRRLRGRRWATPTRPTATQPPRRGRRSCRGRRRGPPARR